MYENKDKMDEVWINYCSMPVCFGWEEFVIVTKLKCYPLSPSQVIPTLIQKKASRTPKKGKGKSSDRDELVSIVSPSFKNKNLIEALKGKGLSKKHKQSLCLVWFVHNVLWARDVNNNISLCLINLSEDIEVWAFQAISYLRQQVNYQEEVSFPRILRWLSVKTDKNAKFLDLFNPPKEAVNVTATTEEHNMTVDNPSTASKDEEKVEPLINDYSEWIVNGLLKHHVGRDCSPFVATYAEYLSDGLQVPNDGLDAGLLRKRYVALLWKYGEAKAQKPYATDVKDPRQPKPNFIALDEEQLIHID
ncbi:hypothetical protein BC332_15917 [Capsicum chinense]|nr:hypothetical protein BC332_15917 [Capsicum chinense]